MTNTKVLREPAYRLGTEPLRILKTIDKKMEARHG